MTPAKTLPKTPKYFVTAEEVSGTNCIYIQSGKYEDTVYHYGTVQLGGDDHTQLRFDYHIIEGDKKLVGDKKFEAVIAAILFDIVGKDDKASDVPEGSSEGSIRPGSGDVSKS